MAYNFELLKEKLDNKEELENFIKINNHNILEEEINSKITLVKQLLGYYNQTLVRSQDLLTVSDFNEELNIKNEISLSFGEIEKIENSSMKLEKLNNIYLKLYNNYFSFSNKVLDAIKTSTLITDYNNTISKANNIILNLNKSNLPKSIIDEVIPFYNEAKNSTDINKITAFINIATTKLNSNENIDVNVKQGRENERIFSLFAKINDQIIDANYLTVNNLVYALYTLEDNSKYYAIIKDEKEIEILNQSFNNLPNLVLTKDNIIETCKLIIKNAGIYYDINEYMRYVEKSYKTKMTKEIDDLILKYKTRLQELETFIKAQLDFIDDIALLVNHKPCPKYPNITYNDIDINNYFPNYLKENDSKLNEIERLIIEVLLNPTIKSEFNTKSILNTLYDESIINSLLTSNYNVIEETPNVNTNDNIVNRLEVTNNIKTNYEKIKDYLKDRVEELKLLESSPKINVTITKDDNNIFKDINTVLDLNTAIIICDKVYKKGQGNYAVIDYLKTGNTLKFTSKYKARDLASNTNRCDYLKLLLENIFKRYLYNNNLNAFIDNIISKDNITVKSIVIDLLNNEEVLTDAINNFDYEYLDPLSEKSKRIDIILNNKSDLKIEKINIILENIKKEEQII